MQFSKLRLVGFKSFVDPTELEIEPGVTGVVGPNGCGKSNLVEGLRWVMGETSAKQMRGSEMDDVIFGGTSDRPARNIAEAVLTLDNADRKATAQFNDTEQLDISRRIEREKGSTYRVNGKEVRARDVHLLFADAATGARSTAMVSQGQIGEVVSAKPTDRRKILEEAAGITGLHSRRHEAELRLRGAETNLERLDDILVTLEAQMQSLRKQLRQAQRYRSINDHIRKAEATLFLLRWETVTKSCASAEEQFSKAEAAVAELTSAAGVAATRQAEAATGLPDLRQAEARAAAALQRLTLARENLDAEERRLDEARRESEVRLSQIAEDIMREQRLAADAEEAIARMSAERAKIDKDQESFETSSAEAADRLRQARAAAESCEERMRLLTDQVAYANAREANLQSQQDELAARVERLEKLSAELAGQIGELETAESRSDEIHLLEREVEQAAEELRLAEQAADAASASRSETARHLAEAHATAQKATADAARLEAERDALIGLLGNADPDLWPPMIDAVAVKAGFELALGAALGDDLSAATDEAAPIHWRTLPALQDAAPLPDGTQPLNTIVQGPAALVRRLGQIGVVANNDDGNRIASELRPGQRLVSRDGALWRWDGFTAAAEATTTAATRLAQRNRLVALQSQLAVSLKSAQSADQAVLSAGQAANAASDRDEAARAAITDSQAKFSYTRERATVLRQEMAEAASKRAAMIEAIQRIDGDLDEARSALSAAKHELAKLPVDGVSEEEMAETSSQLSEKRNAFIDAQSGFEIIRRRAEDREARVETLEAEFTTWTKRRDESNQQRQQLEERRRALVEERDELAERPDELSRQRSTLVDQLEDAEGLRKKAADKLAEAETRLRGADHNLRQAEAQLAVAREERVRAEAAVSQARQALDSLMERIRERLEAAPADLRDLSGLKPDAELPEEEAAERRVDRLLRERENMGPVNLRAEAEAQELAEKIETLDSERGDLEKAIGKLRRGISDLNREGRERLLKSFHEVDKHFQELFVRLFGGGRAHLALTEADDPLEAGIEIMASPPGKRLQVLSLLSGGEQALTALALLFAVFLTNPAPICVLDEVDAPLDDSNVDRFCTLVEEMAQNLATRFLVITHHRMTMARVDRLYGVTMGEQGVSQLVSVDLRQAEQLRATA